MSDFNPIIVENIIECLPNTLFVEQLEFGERVTSGGIYIPEEKMDHRGEFVRPRWAKIAYKAENIKNVNVGDWILIKHGHWMLHFNYVINSEERKLWYISPKSFKEGFLAISKDKPEFLNEYF